MAIKVNVLLATAAAAISLHDMTVSAFTPPSLPAPLCSRQGLDASPLRMPALGVLRSCRSMRPIVNQGTCALRAAASDASDEKGSTASTAPATSASGGAKKSPLAAVLGDKTVPVLCALGCMLCVYALHVGAMANGGAPVGGRGAASSAAKTGFKAWCDFSAGASCSTVAKSQLSVGLGLIKAKGAFGFLALPNSVYGIIYYIALSLTHLPSTFAVFRARQIALILSFAAVLASLWLGYLLIFSIKNLCVVCLATYVINGALLKLSLAHYQAAVAGLRRSSASSVGKRAKGLVQSDRQTRSEKEQRTVAVSSLEDKKEEGKKGDTKEDKKEDKKEDTGKVQEGQAGEEAGEATEDKGDVAGPSSSASGDDAKATETAGDKSKDGGSDASNGGKSK